MHVGPLAMSLVVKPLANVNVTVRVYESAKPIGLIFKPIAFVLAPILPNLHAFALPQTTFSPTALVARAVFKLIRAPKH